MINLKVISKRRKGGGGTKTVESIPAWAVPYLKNVGNEAQRLYYTGQLSGVAGSNQNLSSAFRMGSDIASSAAAGSASLADQQARLTDLAATGGRDALMEAAAFQSAKGAAGLNNQFGASGTLGSARQAVMQGAMDAELINAASQAAFQNKLAAEQAIGNNITASIGIPDAAASNLAQLGSIERDITQQHMDSSWQALQRYASTIYGNPSRQQAVSKGGK